MSKYDINEAFIQALQEQEKEDTTNNGLKLSDKMKEIPVKKGSITATPSIERTMRTARERKNKKDEILDIDVNANDICSNNNTNLDLGGLGDLGSLLGEEKKEELFNVNIDAGDIGSNNSTSLDLGGIGALAGLLAS